MEKENEEIVIDLREIFGILRRRVWTVLMVTALFVAMAGAYIFVSPNMYECSAQLAMGNGLENYFKTRSLFVPIVQTYCEKDKQGKFPSPAKYMESNVKFTRSRNSNFVSIAVRNESPEAAKKIMETIIEGGVRAYVQSRLGDRQEQLRIYQATLAKVTDEKTRGPLLVSIAGIENSIKALRNDIKIVDPPYVEEKPVSPRKVRITAVALVLGLLCGSMYAVLKEKL